MTVSLKHLFQSGKGDGPDTTLVRPSDWNEEHELKAQGPCLLGKAATNFGHVTDLKIGAGLEFNDAEDTLQVSVTGAPIGSVLQFAGSVAPAKWLLCYGQAISRTTYASLFAVIGSVYGSGNGSSTFNVPDCRGRMVAGKDNMGGTGAGRLTHNVNDGVTGTTLGATGGRQSHTVSIEELPSHSHGGQALADGEHAHLLFSSVPKTNTGSTPALNDTDPVSFKNDTGGNATYTLAPDIDGDATVGLSEDGGIHTHVVTTDLVGGNDSGNNMPPTIVMNTIIYAGV